MAKSAEAFRSIGEAATLIGVAPHVLRYWETQFAALKPMKRPDGRRYYRPADVELAAGICALLRDDGLTIKGARKLIAADRGDAVRQRGADMLGQPATSVQPGLVQRSMAQLGLDLHQPVPHGPMPSDIPKVASPRPVSSAHDRTIWLHRLARLSRDLGRTGPDHPRWPQLHGAALALATAMLRLS